MIHKRSAPVRVNVDLLYRCNLHCRYCLSDSGNLGNDSPQVVSEMPTSAIKNLLSSCDALKVFDITLTGGEPFLRKDIWEILGFVQQLQFSSVHLISNGTLINKEVVDRLVKLNLKHLCISLDGDNCFENRLRGGTDVFNRTLAAIKLLAPVMPELEVLTVVTKHNYLAWEKLTNLLLKIGVHKHGITPVCALGRAKDDQEWLGISVEMMLDIQKRVRELKQALVKKQFRLCFNNIDFGINRDLSYLPIHLFTDTVKGWKLVVKANGDVYYDRLWGHANLLGNVKDKSLDYIWKDSVVERRDILKQINAQVKSMDMLQTQYKINPKMTPETYKSEYVIPSIGKLSSLV